MKYLKKIPLSKNEFFFKYNLKLSRNLYCFADTQTFVLNPVQYTSAIEVFCTDISL